METKTTRASRLAAAALVATAATCAAPALAQLPQIQPRTGITAPTRLPPGTFNLRPLRANAVFDRHWNYETTRYDATNAYLATYLATVIYPEFIDQLEGDPFVQDLNFATNLHTNPARFLAEFRDHTAYLFTRPQYAFVMGRNGGGMDPEAVVITTARAVFVVFRGTDRIGPAATGFEYDWGEWIETDFRAVQFVPGIEGFGSAKVHEGFWRSLGVQPSVLRWSANGATSGACFPSPTGETSFRECLAEEVRAAAGTAKPVFVMGHSLGAAHAQLFAPYLAARIDRTGRPIGLRVQGVYAFAAPHVGDDAFKARAHALVGASRLIRFDYVADPVTQLPTYLFGPYPYARIGTRVYYDDLQTTQAGVPERAPVVGSALFANMAGGLLVGGLAGAGAAVLSDMCFHYPQWYLNAAWQAIGSDRVRNELPVPLPPPRWGGRNPKVYGGCLNPATVLRGERSELGRAADAAADAAAAAQEAVDDAVDAAEQVAYDAGQLFANAVGTPVQNGTYYLRLLRGRKFLDVSGSCVGENGCEVQLWDIGRSESNNRFYVEKKGVAYTIRNGSGSNLDFLEVDANQLFRNGGRVQTWEANLPGGNHNPNQLWHFYAVPNRAGMFVIRNVASGKVLDARNACVRSNGCEVRQRDARNGDSTQVWILERAN